MNMLSCISTIKSETRTRQSTPSNLATNNMKSRKVDNNPLAFPMMFEPQPTIKLETSKMSVFD